MKNFQPIPALNYTISDFKSIIYEEKDAFTLAETLITLTVIGVVAALTIPTLMQAWKDRQFETAKKKAMTTVGNGYKLMIAENDGSTTELPLFQCGTDFSCLSEVHRKFFKIGMDKNLTHDGFAPSYTKHDSDEESGFKWDDVPYIFTTGDGMTYGYLAEGNSFEIVVDVNGEKGPNKVCKDLYKINFNGNTVVESVTVGDDTAELCESLDKAANGCSAKDITKCETDADLELLYQSAIADYSEYSKPYIMISPDKCMYIWRNNESYGSGGCDYGEGEHYIDGGKNIGDSFCYAYAERGDEYIFQTEPDNGEWYYCH